MIRLFHCAFVLTAALLLSACGGGSSSASATKAGGAGASPKPSMDAATAATKVNLEEIFPAGAGRDLVLNNCQNCHTFVPIVVLQMEKDAWERNSVDHRERVGALTEEEVKTLYSYLIANFGPHRPVPTLPKELLATWTGY